MHVAKGEGRSVKAAYRTISPIRHRRKGKLMEKADRSAVARAWGEADRGGRSAEDFEDGQQRRVMLWRRRVTCVQTRRTRAAGRDPAADRGLGVMAACPCGSMEGDECRPPPTPPAGVSAMGSPGSQFLT